MLSDVQSPFSSGLPKDGVSDNVIVPKQSVARKLFQSILRSPNRLWHWSKRHVWFAAFSAVVVVALVGFLVYQNSRTHTTVRLQPAGAVSSAYAKRLPALKSAVLAHPKDVAAHKDYAVALYATGDLTGAQKQYQDTIDLNSKDGTAYNNLGNVYRDQGNYTKAVEMYQKAIELLPRGVNSYVNLANVQLYSQAKPDDAIATYKKALKNMPNNTQIEILLGLAYEQAGDTKSAMQTYENVLSYDPANAGAQANLDRLKKS